jgi:hypothetical protein
MSSILTFFPPFVAEKPTVSRESLALVAVHHLPAGGALAGRVASKSGELSLRAIF